MNDGKIISKDAFLRIMNDVHKEEEYIDDINGVFNKYNYGGGYFPPTCVDSLVNLLEFIFEDNNDWIGYYIWELNFGKNWNPGTVRCKDKDIRLDTDENLYDFLVKDLSERRERDND